MRPSATAKVSAQIPARSGRPRPAIAICATAAAPSPVAASASVRTAPGPPCQPAKSGANHATPASTATGPKRRRGCRHQVASPTAMSAHPAASSTVVVSADRWTAPCRVAIAAAATP